MFFAMFVVMPALALAMVRTFNLNAAVKIALVTFALSPIPPLMPRRAAKVSIATDYMIGLLVAASLLSIVFVPLAMELLERIFGRPLAMSPGAVAKQMLLGVLAPLGAGMIVRHLAQDVAERLTKPVSDIAVSVLAACVTVILVSGRHALAALIGNGTILAITVFVGAGLAVGHLLGGPDAERRSVLAISTSTRHPGLAVAMAQANFPTQKLAAAAVVLCLLAGAVLGAPYMRWVNSKRGARSIRARRV